MPDEPHKSGIDKLAYVLAVSFLIWFGFHGLGMIPCLIVGCIIVIGYEMYVKENASG